MWMNPFRLSTPNEQADLASSSWTDWTLIEDVIPCITCILISSHSQLACAVLFGPPAQTNAV